MIIYNIKGLVIDKHDKTVLRGKELSKLDIIEHAWLQIADDKIFSYGTMSDCPALNKADFDASGRFILPTFYDSHTHLVFAGSRELEFIDKIKGIPYEEIAKRGGGIQNSALRLQQTDEDELYEIAYQRLHRLIQNGTGGIEIKSGYGLTVEAELKMLRVISRLKAAFPIPIKATFLGAHTVPNIFKDDRLAYINLIINDMLPKIATEQLADYIDVFCEKVAFSAMETETIIKAGAAIGLKPKIHTNQFNSMGGIEVSLASNAVSVDHLEVMTDDEILHLSKSNTIATLLPSAPFFINDPNFPPARKLLDADVAIALASDYNPGSSPSGNMNFVISLGCIKLRMTPEEAINAATINGAAALEISGQYGSIKSGKIANLIMTKPMSSLAYIPYAFGESQIEQVMINGKWYN